MRGTRWSAPVRPKFFCDRRDGVAFGIVDAHLAVLQVAAFRDHGPARIAGMVARDHGVDVVDSDAEMMEPDFGVRLAQAPAAA